MTTATEAPIETKAGTPAASASAAHAATSGQGSGTAAPAAAQTPVQGAQTAAPAANTKAAGLLAEDPKGAETVKVPVVAEAKTAEIVLKAPEGVTIADETLRAVETYAKAEGLSQKQAENLLARETKGRADADTAWKASQAAEVAKVADVWRSEAEKHPEIGGDKLPVAIADAKRALAAYATPEERKAIADSPFANNPMFIAIMSRAAKGLPVEDVMVPGTGGGAAPTQSAAQIMYPHMYGKKA